MCDFDGVTIRRLRRTAGLTQEELARALGVSFATVNRWENGHTRPSPAAQKLLRSYFRKTVRTLARRSQTGEWAEPVRVLIVDDDPLVRQAFRRGLDRLGAGYRVETAEDGYEAGVKTGVFRPHIVILDVFLPRIDGIRVCRFLKENAETRHTRVIAVTGFGREDTLRKIRQAGADAVLLKPVDTLELLRTVQSLAASVLTGKSSHPGSALTSVPEQKQSGEIRA